MTCACCVLLVGEHASSKRQIWRPRMRCATVYQCSGKTSKHGITKSMDGDVFVTTRKFLWYGVIDTR